MIEAMKQALEDIEFGNFVYAKETLRQAIAEFDSHTLYREGYVNGYAFGEAAGKHQAIAEAEKQEPVACAKELSHELLGVIIDVEEGDGFDEVCLNTIKRVCSQLATHPQPKREWVGLTPTDMEALSSTWWKPNENEMALIDWVEAKLKEKNT